MQRTYHAVHAPVLLLDSTQEEDIRIPVLRKAVFRAGRYGKLQFDDRYLDSLVANFSLNVTGHDIALDFNHQPHEGAAAWIKRVVREGADGEQLVLYAQTTPYGRSQLETGRFRYASAEIDTDFEDRETGKRYGPTLLGAAFTNRPYIHRQAPVHLLSAVGDDSSLVHTVDTDYVWRGLLRFAARTRHPHYLSFHPHKEEA